MAKKKDQKDELINYLPKPYWHTSLYSTFQSFIVRNQEKPTHLAHEKENDIVHENLQASSRKKKNREKKNTSRY